MPTSLQTSVVPFLGVLVQLGGALLLVGFFMLLRRHVVRRTYSSAWVTAWAAFALGIAALVVRYMLVKRLLPTQTDDDPLVRLLYFIFQSAKVIGFVFFLRGTAIYVAGGRGDGPFARPSLFVAALLFAAGSAFFSRSG